MKTLIVGMAALAGAALTFLPGEASAQRFGGGLEAPSITEDVACRTIRERVVRPNGSVAYRTIRRCSPGPVYRDRRVDRCRTIRERIERPNGRVVYRTVRRCR